MYAYVSCAYIYKYVYTNSDTEDLGVVFIRIYLYVLCNVMYIYILRYQTTNIHMQVHAYMHAHIYAYTHICPLAIVLTALLSLYGMARLDGRAKLDSARSKDSQTMRDTLLGMWVEGPLEGKVGLNEGQRLLLPLGCSSKLYRSLPG